MEINPDLNLQDPNHRAILRQELRKTNGWIEELGVGTGWLPQVADERDYRFNAIISGELVLATEPAPVTTNVNGVISITKDLIPSVQDQFYQGACTGGSLANAVGTIARADPKTDWETDYSWQWLYNLGRLAIGELHLDQGAFIRDVVKAAATYGVARESDFPYYRYMDVQALNPLLNPKWVKSASDFKVGGYYQCHNLQECKAAIAMGFPLVLGFLCFQNLGLSNSTGLIPAPSGRITGGHAVMGAQDDERNRLISGPNTWGKDYAPNQPTPGWYHLPYSFWENGHVSDVWAITGESNETRPAHLQN